MGSPDRLEVLRPDEVEARAHHIRELGAGLVKGHFDDLEAALGLAVGVRRGLDALRHDRRGSRDEDPVTDHDGARVPDRALVGRAG